MREMSFIQRLLVRAGIFFLSLSGLPRYWSEAQTGDTDDSQADDSELEAKYGRRVGRRSFESSLERIWDAYHERGGVEGVLRPTTREAEDERIRRKQEKARSRGLQLSRLSRQPGFNILIKFLINLEKGAYSNLRHPENRKDGMSPDYFNGYQNGILNAVEDIRTLLVTSIREYHRLMKEDQQNGE